MSSKRTSTPPKSGSTNDRLTVKWVADVCLERATIRQATSTALLVGTLLAFINHGSEIIAEHLAWSWIAPMLLSYVVPYCVATSGIVQGRWQAKHR